MKLAGFSILPMLRFSAAVQISILKAGYGNYFSYFME